MNIKKEVHFVDNYLISPTNPVTVNLIGSGGTGSQVLTALARINHSLLSLQHPGLSVKVFDNDVVTTANLGRQLFAASEIGLPKAVALINRINRFFGSNWKAVPSSFTLNSIAKLPLSGAANIFISCVDKVAARFEIAEILRKINERQVSAVVRPIYWMDFGNNVVNSVMLCSSLKSFWERMF